MKNFLRFTTLLALPALLAAQPSRKPIYLAPDQLEILSLLPSPPANDSWKTLAELAELHRLQETRTPEQIAHAQADDKEESIFAFADVLGPGFRRTALPHVALLSDHVKNEESIVVNPAKVFFHRPRPYHLDPTIHPVCKTTENRADFSYPSGHGATGYLEALVLVEMVPEKRDAILARADDYALSREICGAHYPSDEVASRLVAYAKIGFIMATPQFKAEFEAARTELRAALKLQ